MALQGDLTTLSVRQLLTWLAEGQVSGQLSLSQGMVVRRFHLRGGKVVLASSSEEPNLLGRLLVDRGLISEDELDRVLGSRGRRRPRLGKALAEAGLVSPAVLGRVLAEKVERLLTGALTWTQGAFHFDDAAPARRPAALLNPVDLGAVLQRTPAAPADAAGSADGSDEEAMPVSDADVIEMMPLAGDRRSTPRRRRRPTVDGRAA